MSAAIEQLIKQAVDLYEQNKLLEAEVRLKHALKVDPKNLPALQIMGLICATQLRYKEAEKNFKRAVILDPKNGAIHYNLAKVLQELGEHRESLFYHGKAIQLCPDNIEALLNYGKSLSKLGEHIKALNIFTGLVKINSNFYEALLNAGATLADLKRYDEALVFHNKAIDLKPEGYDAWANKGLTLSELKRFDEALSSLENAACLRPNHPMAWSNKGRILNQLKRFDEALISFDRSIHLKPDDYDAWANRGFTLSELKRFDEALASHEQAISLKPNYPEAWSNKGITLKEIRKFDEALISFNRAIDLEPNYHKALFNRGILQLQNLNFIDGWQDYEHRWNVQDLIDKKLKSTKPEWVGSKSHNRLLIWGEQGIGDQILFGSILNDLKEFPQEKIVALDGRLLSIFARSFPNYTFIDKDQYISEETYDEQISISSLGKFFRREISDFRNNLKPYLLFNNSTLIPKHQFGNNKNRKVLGISWRSSNPNLGNDKSATLLDFMSILKNINFEFINLQYGETEFEINQAQDLSKKPILTMPHVDLFNDFDSLLSMMNACDVILTTSNSTAHFAGACGKKVLLLLPYSVGKFWYWADINGISLFYPNVKVFQQKSQGDWSNPINEINTYLSQVE